MDIFRVFPHNLLRNPFRKMHVPKFLRRRKVNQLGLEAESLTDIHPDQADDNHKKKNKIEKNWKKQKVKADQRQEPFYLHHFLSDYSDLVGWIPDMESIISSDEFAKDVAGAEGLLEEHQKHKGEIDEDSFRMTAEAGHKLLQSTHLAVDEAKEKLVTLANEEAILLDLWEVRRIQYEQCMDLQLFYRDTEQADAWVSKQETFLANDNLGDSLGSVEELMKKHDFEENLVAEEEKIKALDEFAAKLMEGAHYAADNVATCRDSAEEFHTAAHSLLDSLASVERSLRYDNAAAMPDTEEALLQQLAEYEMILEGHAETVAVCKKLGGDIVQFCHSDSVSTVQRLLTTVSKRSMEVMDIVVQRRDHLSASLDASRNQAAELNHLKAWLGQIEAMLTEKNDQPLPENLPIVKQLLHDHLLLQAEIYRREPEVEKLDTAGQQERGDGGRGDGNLDLPASRFGWKNTTIKREPVDPRLAEREFKNREIGALFYRWHKVRLLLMARHKLLHDMLYRLNEMDSMKLKHKKVTKLSGMPASAKGNKNTESRRKFILPEFPLKRSLTYTILTVCDEYTQTESVYR